MPETPRIRRYVLVPVRAAGPERRRFRLARVEAGAAAACDAPARSERDGERSSR